MARRKKNPSILEDIVLFTRLASQLEGDSAPSIRRLATECKTSPYLLLTAVKRVEQHLGGLKLLHTSEKRASVTALTEEGRRYAQEVERIVEWRPTGRQEIRLAVSHTLFTSQLFTPALAEFQRTSGTRIELHVRVEMDFARIVHDLQTDRIDAAVTWWAKDASIKEIPGVELHGFQKRFDVVLIAADSAQLKLVSQERELLACRRIAILRGERQPALAELPYPDHANGGQRIEMDTIDAVIACVESRVAEFGLVVANYAVLEPLRLAGRLDFDDVPVAQGAQIFGLRAKKTGPLTSELIHFLDRRLASMPNEPFRPSLAPSPLFPLEAEFYEQMAFGYYIDEPRGDQRSALGSAPAWMWEVVRLVRHGESPTYEDQRMFTGRIRNSFGDEFECDASLFGRNLFYVRGTQVEANSRSRSVHQFVSIFTRCHQWDSLSGYIHGHWAGLLPENNVPAFFSTIWSTRKLELAEVRNIGHQVRIRTLQNTDGGINFNSQPDERALITPLAFT